MPRLTDLSAEVLTMILTYLTSSWPGDRTPQHLYGLSRTSRLFNAIATPLLYQIARPYKASTFVRTMYEKPQLAEKVKCLDWTKCVDGDAEHSLMMYFAKVIRETTITPEDNVIPFQLFIDLPARHVFGCLTDVLLTMLPCLEELVVGQGRATFDGGALLQRFNTYPNHTHFSALRRLSYFASRSRGGSDATSIVPILTMSTVRELYLRRCISIASDNHAGVFKVREIVLEFCGFTLPQLEPLIQRTPSLTFFRYQASERSQPPVIGEILIRLDEILTCLEPVEKRLRKVHLHLHCHHGYGPQRDPRDEGALDSLVKFTNLKELEICQSDLTIGNDLEETASAESQAEGNGEGQAGNEDGGDDAASDASIVNGYRFVHKLPNSLERLAIMDVDGNLSPELDYLAHVREDLPNLKFLWTCGHNFDTLVLTFRSRGVTFTPLPGRQSVGPFESWF